MRYTVDVVAGLAFGTDVNTLESDADVIQRHLNHDLPGARAARHGTVSVLARSGLPAADRRLERSVREVRAAIESLHRRRQGAASEDPATPRSARAICSRR